LAQPTITGRRTPFKFDSDRAGLYGVRSTMIASKQARGRDDIEILELAVHRPPGVKRPFDPCQAVDSAKENADPSDRECLSRTAAGWFIPQSRCLRWAAMLYRSGRGALPLLSPSHRAKFYHGIPE
jgi:hypothetical protein